MTIPTENRFQRALRNLGDADACLAEERAASNELRDQVARLERELEVYRRATRGVPFDDLRRVDEVHDDVEGGYPHIEDARRCWVLYVNREEDGK